jgi:myosin heavy subunit
VAGIDDSEDFKETCACMKALGFSPSDITSIFKVLTDNVGSFLSSIKFISEILSGILLLGNLEFEGEDKVGFANPDVFTTLADIWGVEKGVLLFFVLFWQSLSFIFSFSGVFGQSLLGRSFVGGQQNRRTSGINNS